MPNKPPVPDMRIGISGRILESHMEGGIRVLDKIEMFNASLIPDDNHAPVFGPYGCIICRAQEKAMDASHPETDHPNDLALANELLDGINRAIHALEDARANLVTQTYTQRAVTLSIAAVQARGILHDALLVYENSPRVHT